MARATIRTVIEEEGTRIRRFVTVGTVAAGLQTALLAVLVEVATLQYLLAAAIAIEVTILVQYTVNNAWTFGASRHREVREYRRGLVKTNIVRGSAIPLQLAVLYALVASVALPYLLANLFAIAVSGVYRYALESRWTWR